MGQTQGSSRTCPTGCMSEPESSADEPESCTPGRRAGAHWLGGLVAALQLVADAAAGEINYPGFDHPVGGIEAQPENFPPNVYQMRRATRGL